MWKHLNNLWTFIFMCLIFLFVFVILFLFVCYLPSSILHSFSIFSPIFSLFSCLYFLLWRFFEIIIPTKWLKSNIIASRHYSCSHSLNFVTNWSCRLIAGTQFVCVLLRSYVILVIQRFNGAYKRKCLLHWLKLPRFISVAEQTKHRQWKKNIIFLFLKIVLKCELLLNVTRSKANNTFQWKINRPISSRRTKCDSSSNHSNEQFT